MKRLFFAIVICVTVIAGCSSTMLMDNNERNRVFQQMLDKEQFDEAEVFISENPRADQSGQKKVACLKECAPIIKECETVTLTDQAVQKCDIELKQSCNCSKTPDWSSRLFKVNSRISDFDINSAARSRMTAQCGSIPKWGYWRVGKNDLSGMTVAQKQSAVMNAMIANGRRDAKAKIGAFDNLDKCEAARSKDDKFETSECDCSIKQ